MRLNQLEPPLANARPGAKQFFFKFLSVKNTIGNLLQMPDAAIIHLYRVFNRKRLIVKIMVDFVCFIENKKSLKTFAIRIEDLLT